jgi:Domain of unknown function (DUF4331)
MSHHLDSPESRTDPRLNLTDLYVVDGETGTALTMIVNTSLAGDARPRGFHPEARYEFRIHVDGEERESITYRVTFGAADAGGVQALTVRELSGTEDRVVAEGRTGEVVLGDGAARVWAGAAADPFYLDLNQLAHIIDGLQGRTAIALGDWSQDVAASSFTGSSICAIVLELPALDERLGAGRRIGTWGATLLATDAGGWRQINRAAIPMVWPLFRAMGGDDTSTAYLRDTAGHPADDLAADGDRVRDMVTAAARITGTARPEAYADRVARRLLPDVLPYEIGTPAVFGFAGFNGRALADNAPEVMYCLATNTAFPSGLSASDAVETRTEQFPYVVPTKPVG